MTAAELDAALERAAEMGARRAGQARLDGYWPGDIWVIVDGHPARKPRP